MNQPKNNNKHKIETQFLFSEETTVDKNGLLTKTFRNKLKNA